MKHEELSSLLVLTMAVATGIAVGCNYYAQPLLPTIAHAFGVSSARAGFIVTTAQMGYGLGLLLIVPLGDLVERRGLVVGMSLLTAAGLALTALAPSMTLVLAGTALTGLFSVVAQILVPFAATLAAPERRRKVVGMVMSGREKIDGTRALVLTGYFGALGLVVALILILDRPFRGETSVTSEPLQAVITQLRQ